MSGKAYEEENRIRKNKITFRSVFNVAGKITRTLCGMFLAPLDALWGLGKQIYYLAKYRSDYWWSTQPKGDRLGTFLSATYTTNRIFTVVMAGLCIASLLGALVAPIPGLTPIVAASWAAIGSAAGYSIGWCAVARAAGSFLGSIADSWRMYNVNRNAGTKPTFLATIRLWSLTFVKTALFGEALTHAKPIVDWIVGKIKRCFRSSKSSAELDEKNSSDSLSQRENRIGDCHKKRGGRGNADINRRMPKVPAVRTRTESESPSPDSSLGSANNSFGEDQDVFPSIEDVKPAAVEHSKSPIEEAVGEKDDVDVAFSPSPSFSTSLKS